MSQYDWENYDNTHEIKLSQKEIIKLLKKIVELLEKHSLDEILGINGSK